MNLRRTNRSASAFRATLILSALITAMFLAYKCFAHALITAIYEGRTLPILDGLIKYQHKKPVQHYLDLGDSLFIKHWLILGLGTTVVVFFGELVSFLQRRILDCRPQSGNAGPPTVKPQLSWKHLLVIYAFSLLVRAALLPLAIHLPLASDERYYWSVSRNLMNGDFAATILRPPLWGYVLGLPAALYNDPFAGRVLSVLLGALVPVIVALLAQKIFDRKTGVLAAVLYALYPEHVFFSHYVWSEMFFGLLCVAAAYLFFSFAEDPNNHKRFVSCFLAAGVALLAKEFAVILFGAMIIVLLSLKTPHKLRTIAIACVLFGSFATLYSVAASAITGRVIVLNDALLLNLNAATGLRSEQQYSFENREEVARNIFGNFLTTSPQKYIKRFKKEFFRLWAPNSFPIVRLIGLHRPEQWSYGVSDPWPYVYVVAGYYIAIMALGMTGLCLARIDRFWIFSALCLCGLSATAAVAFLCSRFRLPFMFIPVIYAAHLLVGRCTLTARFRNVGRAVAFILLLWLFVSIIIVRVPTFGAWG